MNSVTYTDCDIFTPDSISKQMASYLLKHGSLLDPACGTGNLLTYVDPNQYETIDVYELKEHYLEEVSMFKQYDTSL